MTLIRAGCVPYSSKANPVSIDRIFQIHFSVFKRKLPPDFSSSLFVSPLQQGLKNAQQERLQDSPALDAIARISNTLFTIIIVGFVGGVVGRYRWDRPERFRKRHAMGVDTAVKGGRTVDYRYLPVLRTAADLQEARARRRCRSPSKFAWARYPPRSDSRELD